MQFLPASVDSNAICMYSQMIYHPLGPVRNRTIDASLPQEQCGQQRQLKTYPNCIKTSGRQYMYKVHECSKIQHGKLLLVYLSIQGVKKVIGRSGQNATQSRLMGNCVNVIAVRSTACIDNHYSLLCRIKDRYIVYY